MLVAPSEKVSLWYMSTGKTQICVEILQPSQPKGVMSSVVSLPNHIFTVQA